MKIHIDFESRSTVDIWKAGAWRYATHPSTEILCVAYAIDEGPAALVKGYEIPFAAELARLAGDPNCIFIAHNAFFEQCMWMHIMARRFSFPQIPVERWRCTAAKAMAFGLPKSLEKATHALGLPIEKDMRGRQVMLKLCKPRAPRKDEDKSRVYWFEDAGDMEMLYAYCMKDVEVERALDNALPDLTPFEQRLWFLDQTINSRGVHTDIRLARKAVSLIEQYSKEMNSELRTLTNGAINRATEVKKIVEYLNSQGVDIPSLDKNTVSRYLADKKLPSHVLRVLRVRKEVGRSSTAKYERIIYAADDSGIVRDNYTYHGASTGRWTGKIIQTQNLPRGNKAINTDLAIRIVNEMPYSAVRMAYPTNTMDMLSSCIRGVFIPAPGCDMYVVDYAAIEARMVMWLANDRLGLQEFHDNDVGKDVDIYVKMARRIYNDTSLTKDSKQERQLGKQAILGCGYGMGGDRFMTTCASYGICITSYDADRIVNLYRQTYPSIKNYWYELDRIAQYACNCPNTFHQAGYVKFYYNTKLDYLFCLLPSGRFLSYQKPRMVEGTYGPNLSYMSEEGSGATNWVRKKIWGGGLLENISQAIARDIMAVAMLSLEARGFPVVMHTHDEIVCQIPKGVNRLQEMVNIMCTNPEWATGLPINATGFITERYRKE